MMSALHNRTNDDDWLEVGTSEIVWLSALGLVQVLFFALLVEHRRFTRALLRLSKTSEAEEMPTVMRPHAPLPPHEQMSLAYVDVGLTLPSGKHVLHDVSGMVLPGEMVALMGPSGSGKTSLLDVLAGRREPELCSGAVYANAIDRATPEGGELFVRSSAYMTQLADASSPLLTVQENLAYAAALRLGDVMSLEQQLSRVDEVLRLLRIEDIAFTLVGGSVGGGISGGQKRRLALAVTLLSSPALLLLDEPTSGLDSTATLQVVAVLRELCDAGRSIIMVIHQPREQIFQLFDEICLLSVGGAPALVCSPLRATVCMKALADLVAFDVSNVTNPADVMLDVLTHDQPHQSTSMGVLLSQLYKAEARTTHRDLLCQALKHAARVERPPELQGVSRVALLWTARQAWSVLFLKEHKHAGLKRPTAEIGTTLLLLATLYYNHKEIYPLAASLLMTLVLCTKPWKNLVLAACFTPQSSRARLEMEDGLYRQTTRLVQVVLHFSAITSLYAVVCASVMYLLSFASGLSAKRGLFIVLFVVLHVQVHLMRAVVFGTHASASKQEASDTDAIAHAASLTSLIDQIEQVFSGLYITFADSPAYWKWMFIISPSFQSFPACARIAFDAWGESVEDCKGSVACLSRSGTAFLDQSGYLKVDVTLRGWLLLVHAVVYATIALLITAQPSRWLRRALGRCFVVRTRTAHGESKQAAARSSSTPRQDGGRSALVIAEETVVAEGNDGSLKGLRSLRKSAITLLPEEMEPGVYFSQACRNAVRKTIDTTFSAAELAMHLCPHAAGTKEVRVGLNYDADGIQGRLSVAGGARASLSGERSRESARRALRQHVKALAHSLVTGKIEEIEHSHWVDKI